MTRDTLDAKASQQTSANLPTPARDANTDETPPRRLGWVCGPGATAANNPAVVRSAVTWGSVGAPWRPIHGAPWPEPWFIQLWQQRVAAALSSGPPGTRFNHLCVPLPT